MPPPTLHPLSTPSFPLRPREPSPPPPETPFGIITPDSPPDSEPELSKSSPVSHPTTPIRATSLNPVTPPSSTQRDHTLPLTSLIDPHLELQLPPPFSPLSPPFQIQNLTPDTITTLFQSMTVTKIRCDTEEFLEWKHQNEQFLEDIWGMWEYDAGLFIIKCMPTPMHESFTGYAYEQIISTIRAVTGKSTSQVGVQVLTNSGVPILDPFRYRTIIPDLSTKVRLHPPHPQRYQQSIIFEVGFSQTLHSLRRKAYGWLYGTNSQQVHLVILIDLQEISQSYTDLHTGTHVAKSAARKKVHSWPIECFGGRTFEVEFRRRTVGVRETERVQQGGRVGLGGVVVDVKMVLTEMKNQLKDWLLDKDGKGELIPALLEPIDGHVYAYRRLAEDDGKVQSPVNYPATNQQQEADEISSEDPNTTDTEDDDNDDDSTSDHEDKDNDFSSPSSNTPSEPDATRALDLCFSSQFISSSTPTSPSTTSSSSSEFTLAIAELFGPLPNPSTASDPNQSLTIPTHLLDIMPPLSTTMQTRKSLSIYTILRISYLSIL